MHTYVIRRLIASIPVVLLVTIGSFALIRVIPGDIAVLKLGPDASEESLEAFRHQLGLDKPILTQYVEWLGGILRGDFGDSLWESRPVLSVLKDKFPVTIELALLSVAISSVLAIPMGVISAVRQDSLLDQWLRFIAILFLAVPAFWLAILIVTLPAMWWGWKPPTTGYSHFWDAPLDNLWRLFWPSLVIGASSAALILRLTRSSLLEVLRQDYIRTAWAKGLRERVIMSRHALKNALIPVITALGLQLSVLLGGAVIAEQIFALPGMGRSLLGAITRRDYPLLQSYVLVFAVIYVVMNLIVDLLYGYLDPRIRYN